MVLQVGELANTSILTSMAPSFEFPVLLIVHYHDVFF
jgi:hypothetical protein